MSEPFLKWAGGKRQLVNRLMPLVTSRIGRCHTYWEPFLGGGALALALSDDVGLKAVADACAPLVNAWLCVRDSPLQLGEELQRLGQEHDAGQYYAVRAQPDRAGVVGAARFIYLNKMGFNGLYRVNRSGRFNVPLGRGRVSALPTGDELLRLSERIHLWTVECADFEVLIDRSTRGDVVFADPPYDGTFSYSSGFVDEDRVRLAYSLMKASERGVAIILCDADTARTRELYGWAELTYVGERRRVSCKTSDRPDADCLLVTA